MESSDNDKNVSMDTSPYDDNDIFTPDSKEFKSADEFIGCPFTTYHEVRDSTVEHCLAYKLEIPFEHLKKRETPIGIMTKTCMMSDTEIAANILKKLLHRIAMELSSWMIKPVRLLKPEHNMVYGTEQEIGKWLSATPSQIFTSQWPGKYKALGHTIKQLEENRKRIIMMGKSSMFKSPRALDISRDFLYTPAFVVLQHKLCEGMAKEDLDEISLRDGWERTERVVSKLKNLLEYAALCQYLKTIKIQDKKLSYEKRYLIAMDPNNR